jgi:hypothetical protein
MASDKAQIRRMLNEVAQTSGYASARKADELLRYMTSSEGDKSGGSGETAIWEEHGLTPRADGDSDDSLPPKQS